MYRGSFSVLGVDCQRIETVLQIDASKDTSGLPALRGFVGVGESPCSWTYDMLVDGAEVDDEPLVP